jgi:hypothetical protein
MYSLLFNVVVVLDHAGVFILDKDTGRNAELKEKLCSYVTFRFMTYDKIN